jgi:hypothetical protein
MSKCSRTVWVLGAGFSKPSGLPLAKELLDHILDARKLREHEDLTAWLSSLQERLKWLEGRQTSAITSPLNIEQVFDIALFDVETHRLRQHLVSVGRYDGDTPWSDSEDIGCWLSYLEEDLIDVIQDKDIQADLTPIERWAGMLQPNDSVLTFNYDTLVERALSRIGTACNHGMKRSSDVEIAVYKLHGSIDWIVAHRSESFEKLELLFDKRNTNCSDGKTGNFEDDCRLWRCSTPLQTKHWINSRVIQRVPKGACFRSVGIAGLGTHKPLHLIPGLGRVWSNGMSALHKADRVVFIGFALSDHDAMATMQFAQVAMDWNRNNRSMLRRRSIQTTI